MLDLEALLAAASEAEPADRIAFRDSIAGYGGAATPSLMSWIEDPRLGAFAVRVLELIARSPDARSDAVDALAHGAEHGATASIRGDAEDALVRLSRAGVTPMRRRSSNAQVPVVRGRPGVPGRGYWATHTWERGVEHGSKQRAYVWAEIRKGHLRQGWGWEAEQDLRLIDQRQAHGLPLTDVERMAWRARRMLTSREDAIQVDDLVVAVAVPEPDKIVVVKVIGPYEFDVDPAIRDYGHLLPIRALGEPIARSHPKISQALTHALRNRSRLWRIDGVGGDIEDVIR